MFWIKILFFYNNLHSDKNEKKSFRLVECKKEPLEVNHLIWALFYFSFTFDMRLGGHAELENHILSTTCPIALLYGNESAVIPWE